MNVPWWGWAGFLAFVAVMLALDLGVLQRRPGEVSLRRSAIWSALWVAVSLGFAALLWIWAGGGTAQAYLAGYLIEKSLSLDNVFVFTLIFAAFAVPPRHQHRVLTLGIVGALAMRAVFILAGVALVDVFHPVMYVFGAVLLYAAARMLRGGHTGQEHGMAQGPASGPVPRVLQRLLPATSQLHGQRFWIRDGRRVLATPLLLALIAVEVTDVIFAVDSIPAVLAVTTDPFVVYTSNVFALLGMRALYHLLAGAAGRFRYLRPGLAVILAAVAVKLLLDGVWHPPVWSSPVFIAAVLAVVAVLSARDARRHTDSRPAAPRQEPAGAVIARTAPIRPSRAPGDG